MPAKKTQARRRSDRARTQARPARVQPGPRETVAEVPETDAVAVASAAVPPSPAAATAPRPSQSGARTVSRRPAPARRPAPRIAIDYSYLRRDLTRLVLLAVIMVIALVFASIVLR